MLASALRQPPDPVLPHALSCRPQAAQRLRRRRSLASVVAVTAGALVVLSTGRHHHADLLTAQAAPTDLGLPAEAAALASSLGSSSDGGRSWRAWQQRLEQEEARVASWRERQRSAVREETAAEQAVARASAQQRWNTGVRAAREAVSAAVSAAAAAAAADPFIDADEALARRQDQELPATAWDLQLPAAGDEQQQQQPLSAGALGGGALAAEERR